jgi:hypothetical protein
MWRNMENQGHGLKRSRSVEIGSRQSHMIQVAPQPRGRLFKYRRPKPTEAQAVASPGVEVWKTALFDGPLTHPPRTTMPLLP